MGIMIMRPPRLLAETFSPGSLMANIPAEMSKTIEVSDET